MTSEYDDIVKQRITQENRPRGLFIDKPNHRVWIKSWAELIRDCEARLKFVQDQLRIEVSTEEIQDRIARLPDIMTEDDPLRALDLVANDFGVKPAPTFAETRPDEVFGMLFRKGKPTTLEKMDAGVLAEARRRHPRD